MKSVLIGVALGLACGLAYTFLQEPLAALFAAIAEAGVWVLVHVGF